MKRIVSKLDIFGVPIQMRFDDNQDTYKSFIGGVTSVILLVLSMTYALYIFIQRYQGYSQVSTNSVSYNTDFAYIYQDGSLVRFSFQKLTSSQIDPFRSQGNILTPLLLKMNSNNQLVQQTVLLNDSDSSASTYGTRYIDSTLIIDFFNVKRNVRQAEYFYYLAIVQCVPQLMKTGQYCASQSDIDQFFAYKGNQIAFDYEFQTIDSWTLQTSINLDTLYINIEPEICYMQDSDLKSTRYLINNFLFYDSPYTIELIDDQRIQSQSQTIDYCQKQYFGYKTYIAMYLQLRNLQTLRTFNYPNLGQLLAQVGSIISVLFFIKYIIIFINEHYLFQQILTELIEFYYPEVRQIKILRNWYGKTQKIVFKDNEISSNVYAEFMTKTKQIMQQKYTYRNIIYELSRMQFVLRSIQSINLIQQSHHIGIKLKLQNNKDEENIEISNLSSLLLSDDDCELFSYSRRTNLFQFIDEPGAQQFYLVNFIDGIEEKLNKDRKVVYQSLEPVSQKRSVENSQLAVSEPQQL